MKETFCIWHINSYDSFHKEWWPYPNTFECLFHCGFYSWTKYTKLLQFFPILQIERLVFEALLELFHHMKVNGVFVLHIVELSIENTVYRFQKWAVFFFQVSKQVGHIKGLLKEKEIQNGYMVQDISLFWVFHF